MFLICETTITKTPGTKIFLPSSDRTVTCLHLFLWKNCPTYFWRRFVFLCVSQPAKSVLLKAWLTHQTHAEISKTAKRIVFLGQIILGPVYPCFNSLLRRHNLHVARSCKMLRCCATSSSLNHLSLQRIFSEAIFLKKKNPIASDVLSSLFTVVALPLWQEHSLHFY